MTAHALTTSTATSPRTATLARSALLLAAAIVVAALANAVVASVAIVAGASAAYQPLMPPAYVISTIVGIMIGYVGWRVVRRLFANPAAVLRVLVPVFLVLSLVPNVILGILQYIPGTNVTAAVALGIMHIVVVAVGVPVYARIAPVR